MKKIKLYLMIGMMAVGLAGCGQTGSQPEGQSGGQAEEQTASRKDREKARLASRMPGRTLPIRLRTIWDVRSRWNPMSAWRLCWGVMRICGYWRAGMSAQRRTTLSWI